MTRSFRVIMNGVTGRMGHHQHLVRSVLAIRDQGGVELADGARAQLEPVLVGRNPARLAQVAAEHGLLRWTTDLAAALADPSAPIYFDAQVTQARAAAVTPAIEAGKAVYCEKPLAGSLGESVQLARLARQAGVKNAVVHDKLFLPGIRKLKRLLAGGFFGRVLSVRAEFGYWVFEGGWQPAQRPSWNYRSEDGGGIVTDMFAHWSYLLEHLFGRVEAVTARAVTHVPRRADEQGREYRATADDAAYAIFELAGGVIAQINSSWCTRVFRDELVEFQVDGTEGSAVAGLWRCRAQHRALTPRAVWNPDQPDPRDYRAGWQEVPDNAEFGNAFKAQWEQFIRHVAEDGPSPYDFAGAARGVQLAEAGLRSSAEGRRVVIPDLGL